MTPAAAADRILLAGFAVAVAGLAWLSLPWPLVHDTPILHYIAWRISDGQAPYRDLFDMNFPGTYAIHWAVLKLGGAGNFAWRVFDLLTLAATGGLIWAFAAPWGRAAATGGALLFALYHLAGGAWLAGQRDYLMCPLLIAGALGVARWAEGDRASLAWGGLALGAAATIKPHALLFAVALGVLVVTLARRAPGGAAPPLITFATSVAAAPVAALTWVWALGGLGAWLTLLTDYLAPLYRSLGRPASWAVHRGHAWIPLVLAAAGSLGLAVAGRRLTLRHGIAALGVLYGVAHWLGQGKGWEYHLYPLAAFCAILAWSGLEPAWATGRRAVVVALAACLAAVLLLLSAKGWEASTAAAWWDKERVVRALTLELPRWWKPGDTVQVLDTTDGGIHALLRLRAVQPTRFVYDFPLFQDPASPVIRGFRAEFMRDLVARPPRFIVVFRSGWPSGGPERLDRFPELRERLARAYEVRQPRLEYVIYEKRDDS
ncbi:MAG: hypothetical protein ACRELS_20800 [Candidatus Rokuibacteriota bacterium]